MATVAVGHKLKQEGTFTRKHPITRIFDCLRRGNDVHTVCLDARDLVSAREVLRVGRAAVGRGAHSVFVVLAHKHAGEVPQFGHVERLEHLALITRAVTVERKRGGGSLEVLLRKRDTGADGHLCAYDTVPTKEAWCEDVHGAALPVGHAGLTTEELADNAGDCTTTKNGKWMTAVGRDDHVVLGYRRFEADRDGFLNRRSQDANDTSEAMRLQTSVPGQWQDGRSHG